MDEEIVEYTNTPSFHKLVELYNDNTITRDK